ncbi:MAG: MoaD family protein [Candidatus Methylarchaceae archaeon HK01M]|nr:MoaD family protein [Candidatus Methylarchaceae archaeon HK01M]
MPKNEEITIKLRYFANIREITGKMEEPVVLYKGDSVMDAFSKLNKIYGEKISQLVFEKKSKDNWIFLVNGEAVIDLDKRKLKDGDILAILPPISGG